MKNEKKSPEMKENEDFFQDHYSKLNFFSDNPNLNTVIPPQALNFLKKYYFKKASHKYSSHWRISFPQKTGKNVKNFHIFSHSHKKWRRRKENYKLNLC